MADLVILSKTDLAADTDVAQLQNRLASLNPRVRITPIVKGAGVASQIWGLGASRPDAAAGDLIGVTS